MSQFKVGDKVRVHPDYARTNDHRIATWEIVKVNPVNLKVKHTVTGGLMNVAPECLVMADGPFLGLSKVEEIPMPLNKGALVSFRTAPRGWTTDDLFVVTGESAKGYQLFPLGGSTRYFRGVNPKHVVERKVVSVTTEVVA